ncbi:MAG: DKNYY domain-containing protein [Sebaldella sp.]|nr:DKNYY domain-containing protein [Sebaldella sp.]
MKKIILFIIISVLSLSEYKIIENEVLYIYPHTENTVKDSSLTGVKVLGVDIKTFESLDNGYAKDKKNIYYEGKKIRKADIETFSAYYGARLEEPIIHYDAKDKKNYYYEGNIVNKK